MVSPSPVTRRVETIAQLLHEHLTVARGVERLIPEIERAAAIISESYRQGGKLLLCGNGGSAADAQHIAAEFVGRFLRERRAMPAIALHTNPSSVTAIGNDYGFDTTFSRPLEAFSHSGDTLVAITTSGNSANVVRAAQVARERGVRVIGLTGASGGELEWACDICLRVPSESTPRVQELHIFIGHVLCGLVEEYLD